MPDHIPPTEDGIIKIAEKLYGKDTEDYRVFSDAATVRKTRRRICIRFEDLLLSGKTSDGIYYQLSEEFNMSVSMIKKVIQRKEVYLK